MSQRGTYVYGSAARRLSPEPYAAPARQTRASRQARADVRVVRGAQSAPAVHTQASPSIGRAVAIAVTVLLVVAAAACLRLALSSAAIATSLDSQSLSNSINDVRTTSTSLEIEQSTLANPARITAEAKRLGMVAPKSVGVIELGPDVVVLDESGALSLSGSVSSALALEG